VQSRATVGRNESDPSVSDRQHPERDSNRANQRVLFVGQQRRAPKLKDDRKCDCRAQCKTKPSRTELADPKTREEECCPDCMHEIRPARAQAALVLGAAFR